MILSRGLMMRRMLVVYLLVLLLPTPVARAQDSPEAPYPEKIVRIVVPFTAGGAVDLVARIMAKYLSETFKREVYVENRPGASGNVGAETVAQASADGYTLLVSASTLVVNPVVAAEQPPFDPLKDFSQLGLIAKGPLLFITHPGVADSVQDFVVKARSHPESFNFATGGYGSAGHMAAESFKLRAGLNVPVVLYKGTGPAFTDLMGGTISGMLDPLLTSLPLAQGKQATALAIASPMRNPLAPDVPTFTEAGYPGFEFYTWYGLWGPAHLPANVVTAIEQALAAIGKSNDTQKWFASQGLQYSGIGGSAFLDFSRSEQALYGDIMKRGNMVRQ
jgi:tripartite-type tricarboxylate transporter receptor subunit TctC